MRESIIIGLMAIIFIGCGSSNSVENSRPSDTPKSPIIQEKDKVPPSIPNV